MRTAMITIAGISSRFNEKIPEEKKVLKAIYNDNGPEFTLLYHLLKKCSYADRIIIVGGYKYDELSLYFKNEYSLLFPQAVLVKNDHFEDLSSGYSLLMGIKEAECCQSEEVLFVEGDLDMDDGSFAKVVDSEKSVLTYIAEPIYSNKAVVLYRDSAGKYKYAFNSEHGFLSIDEPFACILNSGQTWKFTDMDLLKKSADEFESLEKDGTNLRIIQRYIDKAPPDSFELIRLERWTNCNTRDDYYQIADYWRTEK